MEWSAGRASALEGTFDKSLFGLIPNEVHFLLLSHLPPKKRQALQRVCYLWGYLIASELPKERSDRTASYSPTKKENDTGAIKKLFTDPLKSLGKKLGLIESGPPLYRCTGIDERRLNSDNLILKKRFIRLPEGCQASASGSIDAHRIDIKRSSSHLWEDVIKSLKHDRLITHLNIALPEDHPTTQSIIKALCFNQTLTDLSFAGSKLSQVALATLGRNLKEIQGLRCLDFTGCELRSSDPFFLVEGIQVNSVLTSLKLKGHTFAHTDLLKLIKALKTSAIANLHLGKCISTQNDKNEVIEALGQLLEGPKALTHLHFEYEIIGSASGSEKTLCEAVKRNSTLRLLHLKGNFINDKEITALTEALSVHPTLSHLHLASCMMSKEKAHPFVEALRERTAMQAFKISLANAHAKIDPLALGNLLNSFKGRKLKFTSEWQLEALKSFDIVPKAISSTSTLTYLDISRNVFGDGLKQIAEALKVNETILYVNLSYCYDNYYCGAMNGPSEEVMRAFKELLEANTPLISLKLQGTEFSISKSFNMIATGLEANHRLAYLDISGCDIYDEQVHALAKALEVNMALTDLNLASNNIRSSGGALLAAALKHNSSLTHLNMEYNPLGDKARALLANISESSTVLTRIDLIDPHEM